MRLNTYIIARICHEANRAWCEANGDFSQPKWDAASPEIMASAMKGVAFAQANPDAPDSAQHDQWARDKLDTGWVYGEVKDTEKKTHPCLVPFKQLPPVQQYKDKLFRAVVKALS